MIESILETIAPFFVRVAEVIGGFFRYFLLSIIFDGVAYFTGYALTKIFTVGKYPPVRSKRKDGTGFILSVIGLLAWGTFISYLWFVYLI